MPNTTPLTDQRFGSYRVLQREDGTPWRLGAGSMGITYKAWDDRLQITVALKVITPALLHNESSHALFVREARLAARVRDAHVANVLAMDDTPGAAYYAMEFVPGVTLAEFLRARGRLSPALALSLGEQIMEALAAIHAEGLVHRDLKPANIMVLPARTPGADAAEEWQVKVIDFGLAKTFEAKSRADETVDAATQGFRGTALYASPEQCEERTLIDGRSDLYSAGCVLWEMLAGQPPFFAYTHRELMNQHVSQPPPLDQVRRLPAALRAVLVHFLAKDPEGRFPDARNAAEALRRALAELTPAEAIAVLPPSPAQAATALAVADTVAGAAGDVLAAGVSPWRRRWELGIFGVTLLAAAYAWWLQLVSPVRSGGGARARVGAAAASTEKSIAVLPFENLAVEKENEFFAAGLQEDILTNLAKIAQLRVINQSSVQSYSAPDARDLRQIAAVLGVRYVLEGSVQQAGAQLRINVQLSDTSTGAQVWARRFDRATDDLFAVQIEVAEAVTSQMEIRLTPADKVALAQRTTKNLPAYFLYVRALSVAEDNFDQVGSKAAILQSVKLLEEAVRLDPGFLLAHCQMAKNHDALFWLNHDRTPARLALASAALARAERLAPNAGVTLLTRARHVFWGSRDFAQAKALLARARRSEPNNAEIPQLLGSAERRLGRWQEATDAFVRSLQLDPRSQLDRWLLTTTLRFQRRYTEAARSASLLLELVPKDVELLVLPERLQFDQEARTEPLRRRIEGIVSANPKAVSNLAALAHELALCERDPVAAARAAAEVPPEGFTWVEDVMPFPREWFEALAARAGGDASGAEKSFREARTRAEERLRATPDDPNKQMVLALIEAGLGRRESALRGARAASAAIPLERDAIDGSQLLLQLAVVCTATGETDEALRALERIAAIPSALTYGLLRLHPKWDPLRGDPRFAKLLATLQRAGR